MTDTNDPLSFKEWQNARVGIIPGQEYALYNQYLTNWYKEKVYANSNTEQLDSLKIRYLALLGQLQVFFTAQEKEKWYNFINFDEEREILLAIPYFAKKLKEISLYYIELRKKLKKSKIQYNLGGTNTGFILDSQDHILSNFTSTEYNSLQIPAYILNNVPELSSIRESLVIQIEEIYDDHSYLDQSLTVPVSAYYNLNDTVTEDFFKTKGLNLPELEWLFSNTIAVTGEMFDPEANLDLANEYIVKYSGQDKYTSSVPMVSTGVEFFDVSIETGNNYFLWPSGAYRSEVIPETRYIPVSLTSVNIENQGTAGATIQDSDTIFIKDATGTKGAWLRYKQNEIHNSKKMLAYFDGKKKTSFIFPFPGYGLSGENMQWTGPSYTYTSEFFYLDNNYKKSVESAYWNLNYTLTSIDPLYINSTSLIDSKAFASVTYTNADKIRIWQTPPYSTELSYKGESSEGWLYKFSRTDIPVAPNAESIIVWPFERIDKEADFPTHYPEDLFVCNTIKLTSIEFPVGIASNALSSSDVIYKLSNYKHTKEQAIECAWLSGNSIGFSDSNIILNEQPGLNIIGKPGVLTRFVWNGNTQTDVNYIFKNYNHQVDCPFVTDSTVTYKDHSKCTCKSVLFTPFGHPGATYTDNNSYADIIFEDTDIFNLKDIFTLSDWRDSSSNDYRNSLSFAWYKTAKNIGFGDGKWVTEVLGGVPRLVKGKPYCFYRANLKSTDTEVLNLPSLTLRHTYNKAKNFTWIKAKKETDGTWTSTGQQTNMLLNQEDVLLYSRPESTTFYLTGSNEQTVSINENKGNLWANYDYLTVANPTDPLTLITQTVYVSYPTASFSNPAAAGSVLSDVPAFNRDKIISVKEWSLTDPSGFVTKYKDVAGFSFTPLLTGLYNITVTAVTGVANAFTLNNTGSTVFSPGVTGLYVFNNIHPIEAIWYKQRVPSLTAVNTPAPGFVLNTNLYGWDYDTSSQHYTTTPGARPFWALSETAKTEKNKYKGIESWGTPLRYYDEHNIITQPEFSDIDLRVGQYVEYSRQHSTPLKWEQLFDILIEVNEKQWCAIDFDLSSSTNLNGILDNLRTNIDLTVVPTTSISPITLTNIIENEAVEVHYNAITPFVWNITATPQIVTNNSVPAIAEKSYTALRPWAQLVNRFNNTVAHVPTLENIYAQKNTGGYFLPNNLGLSLYNSKDYSFTLSTSSENLTSTFEGVDSHFAGRGITKQDQLTPYTSLQENATWMKDSFVAGALAGNVNRDVIKKYQKFIPYQPSSEPTANKQYGLVTTKSKLTPWGGAEDKKWIDELNKPSGFVGEFSTENWINTQVLKNTTKRIYNWTTDIFGNQYALFKDTTNADFYTKKNILGELWVRKNSQIVQPAYIALNDVFDTYKGLSLYNELTGSGIKKIDVFFDTLYIETTGAVLLEKIIYDYEADNIFSFVDSSHVISLPWPLTTNLNREYANYNLASLPVATVGDTWFFPEQKLVLLSICELNGGVTKPCVYELDIAKEKLNKVFPV